MIHQAVVRLLGAVALTMGLAFLVSAGRLAGPSRGLGYDQILPPPYLGEGSVEGRLLMPPKPVGPADLVEVMVELEDPPLARVYAEHKSPRVRFDPHAMRAALPYLERIEQAQDRVEEALTGAAIHATVMCSVQRVYNGIAVQVAAGKMAAIRHLPEVKTVRVLTPRYLTLDTSVPHIGAPAVWNAGATGSGVRIGVIDTGVDYTHMDLGGSGNPLHFATNNPTVIGDIPGFPGTKVVGGFDFVGDDYDASSSVAAARLFKPDPDPMDARTHGTSVAAIAAGLGILSDGSAFLGPYDATTPSRAFHIGPGVAPGALLFPLKVFGRGGTTSAAAVVAALERVVDPNGDFNFSDRLDVVNMSLGAPWVPLDAPDIVATDAVAQVGTVPVVAAGNWGDTFYGANTAAEGAISVAASVDNGLTFQRIQINSPPRTPAEFDVLSTIAGWGPPLAGAITADVVAASPFDGCAPFTNPAAMNGKIAFFDATTCSLPDKVRNAQAAGAVGALMGSSTSELPLFMADASTQPGTTIPSFFIGKADTDWLKTTLASGTTVRLTLTPGNVVRQPGLADTLASFSARGPVGDFLKPDVAAPGVQIFAAQAGTGSGGAFASGTSAAAAHVSGSVALLHALYPTLSLSQIKNIMKNTAGDVYSGANSTPPRYGPGRVGAGRGWAGYDGDWFFYRDRTDLGDIPLEVVGNATRTQNYRLVNASNVPQTFNLSYDRLNAVPGVNPIFPATVTVTGNGQTSFQMQWTVNAAQLKGTRDATVSATQSGAPRYWLTEESGFIKLNQPGRDLQLRLPVQFPLRPASATRAAQNPINLNRNGATVNIPLVGTGVHTGNNFPTDWISVVSPFELQESSPNDASSSGYSNIADIKYTGILTDFLTVKEMANTRIIFGFETYADWHSPNELVVEVRIDTNRDGIDDFALFTSAVQNEQNAGSDVFVTALRNLKTGAVSTTGYLNVFTAAQLNIPLHNTNSMSMSVRAADLGLTNANTIINYRVVTYLRGSGVPVDGTLPLTYDIARPKLDFGPLPIYYARPGDQIPVRLGDGGSSSSTARILLFYHLNTAGNRDEVLGANW